MLDTYFTDRIYIYIYIAVYIDLVKLFFILLYEKDRIMLEVVHWQKVNYNGIAKRQRYPYGLKYASNVYTSVCRLHSRVTSA